MFFIFKKRVCLTIDGEAKNAKENAEKLKYWWKLNEIIYEAICGEKNGKNKQFAVSR